MASPELGSVDQVLRGLDAALSVLVADSGSPVQIFQALESFTEKSQQLTNMMRKEFQAATGREWVASDFDGWNAYSSLFKELRRTAFHEAPVRLGVYEEKTFNFSDGRTVSASANVEMSFPEVYGDSPRPELRLEAFRDGTVYQAPVTASFSEYTLAPSTDLMRKKVLAAGTNRLSTLARECARVLHEYTTFYKAQLAQAAD